MPSDSDIKRDVEAELDWDPDLHADDIAVAVKGAVVALTGYAPNFLDKWSAERIAKRVHGVRGVANDIEVRLPVVHRRPDPEIARHAVAVLALELPTTHERITVTVKDGEAKLEGDVEWHQQKERAESVVRHLRGVKNVVNMLWVSPVVTPKGLKREIEAALVRSAEVDAQGIEVEADGGEVVLKGTVRSWAEQRAAEAAAWRAQGVKYVQNHLTVAA